MQKKRGQMQLSFGMIFSIILIIFFVAIAFYAIKVLLNTQNSIKNSNFKISLQDDVDKIWKSSKTSQETEYILSSKIKKICFVDFSIPATKNESLYNELKKYFSENENLFLYPISSYKESSMHLKNIDLEKTTELGNPLCFDILNSKVRFILEKNLNESLVTIK